MILPTLVVGVQGVGHLGNDRTGNPFFVGELLDCKVFKWFSFWKMSYLQWILFYWSVPD